MKHLFIVNPAARQGNRTTFVTSLVHQVFDRRGEPFEIYITRGPLDAVRKIQEDAAVESDLRVYACGGDGTVNECASACAGRNNVSMTVFPCGTGNDFVKLFGDEQGKFKNFAALADGEVHPLDIIRVNDRYSVNICSVGLDSRVGVGVHEFDNIPVIGRGKSAYILSALVNFCRKVTDDLTVTINGQLFKGEMTAVCVCNGTWYGGSFNPVPEAEPDDGLLDVLVVEKVSLLQVASVIGHYQKGRYADYPELIRHARCRSLRIECAERSVVNVDGEAVYTTDAKIEVVPHAIRFFYPKGLSYHAKNSQSGHKFAEITP